jgi:hypothetical protein
MKERKKFKNSPSRPYNNGQILSKLAPGRNAKNQVWFDVPLSMNVSVQSAAAAAALCETRVNS